MEPIPLRCVLVVGLPASVRRAGDCLVGRDSLVLLLVGGDVCPSPTSNGLANVTALGTCPVGLTPSSLRVASIEARLTSELTDLPSSPKNATLPNLGCALGLGDIGDPAKRQM